MLFNHNLLSEIFAGRNSRGFAVSQLVRKLRK